MSHISKNLHAVKEKIRNAYFKRSADLQSRQPCLVAVSKLQPKDFIIEAYKCGQEHFGENYVQEIIEKAFDEEILKTCPNIKWHFIGHLQKNKVNKLLTIPNLFIVETVDSEKLALALNSGIEKIYEKQDHTLNVFVQVNTSGEKTKSGCGPDEVTKLVKFTIENCKRLNVMGLMTIGKYDNYEDKNEQNPDFQCLISCRDNVCRDLNINKNDFDLSMGMSGDFEKAVCKTSSLKFLMGCRHLQQQKLFQIEVGATNVRVGTLIFGERHK